MDTLKLRKDAKLGADDVVKSSGSDAVLAKSMVKPPNDSKIDPAAVITKIAKNDWNGSGILYYLYHSILLVLYFAISLYRAYEYSWNKVKLQFLTLAYNPSKTPLLINEDINKLPKIPKRVSTILNLKPEEDENGGVNGLLSDSSDVISWCLCSGIQELSIYEKNGTLKKHIPELRRAIRRKLVKYFGTESIPNVAIKIPHLSLIFYGYSDEEEELYKSGVKKADVEVSLLSVVDGRSTIVDLTRIISEMSLKNELKLEDIKIQFIDDELTELVGPEPDLLILFQPSLDLQGYPPWHIRLTEIYWEKDNDQVDYSIFYRAFKKYSTSKVNVGK